MSGELRGNPLAHPIGIALSQFIEHTLDQMREIVKLGRRQAIKAFLDASVEILLVEFDHVHQRVETRRVIRRRVEGASVRLQNTWSQCFWEPFSGASARRSIESLG